MAPAGQVRVAVVSVVALACKAALSVVRAQAVFAPAEHAAYAAVAVLVLRQAPHDTPLEDNGSLLHEKHTLTKQNRCSLPSRKRNRMFTNSAICLICITAVYCICWAWSVQLFLTAGMKTN